jgi:hypothetical protein
MLIHIVHCPTVSASARVSKYCFKMRLLPSPALHIFALQRLFQKVLRRMTPLVVTMHVCPFDTRKALKFDLQIFSDVVTVSERLVRVQDNVDLDYYTGSTVPCADSVKRDDVVGVCHCCELLVRVFSNLELVIIGGGSAYRCTDSAT